MIILNKFHEIFGLKLNKEKTKAMWIGSTKNNETNYLYFQQSIFFVKIHKMDIKLRMWQRDQRV